MQLDNVFVVEDVISPCVLAIVNAGASNSCGFKLFSQLPMNGYSSRDSLLVGNGTYKPFFSLKNNIS
jgi:hypothetical protein